MNFDQRKATSNWADVDYNRDVWIPVPIVFPGTRWADAAEWAYDYAGDRVMRTHGEVTRKMQKKEVLPLAEALVQGRSEAAGKVAAHKLFFHCPNSTKMPVVVGIGLWRCEGTREEAFQYYSYWGTKTATTQPVAEWFETTENLGTGVKAQWSGVTGPGQYWQINYVFRNDEFDTDVHIFTMAWDRRRFDEMLPDLDRLARSIRCKADPDRYKSRQEASS